MRKSTTGITAVMLLGFFALGLFAGCSDVLGGPPAELTGGGFAGARGRVVIRLGAPADGARTLMPASAGYESLSYTYEFTSEGADPVSGPIIGGTARVELEAGTWVLTVEGRNSADGTQILKGTVTGIVVSPETSTPVSVPMKGYTEAGAGNGTLNYSVTLPVDVTSATLMVYAWDNYTQQGGYRGMVNLSYGNIFNDDDPDTKTSAGTIPLPGGMYRVALDLYKADGVLSRTDIAHIYPEMATEALYTFGAGDFTPAVVNNGLRNFTEVLESIPGLESGADVLYVLPARNSASIEPTSITSSNPVTVTIDGGGGSVTSSTYNTRSSLISVGNNVTLVLKNITLDVGLYNNPLVTVRSGGTLEIGTGVLITAASGNGVYVLADGTFIMNGGKISGSTTSSGGYGSGVTVGYSGTFIMNDGEISGNTASRDGGGVYAAGSFTMNGGKISGNTASSDGGGVHATGAFTMNGGEISGNTASRDGGGVYATNFTMNGGEISGNTASSRDGGGVHATNFTMNGGEISGNTASSDGGGVHAYTFTMSGGKISGNTASRDGDGGGVYATGTFTMSGGEISGNIVSSSSTFTRGGGGVHAGTFTMSGGEISGNIVSSSSTFTRGGGVHASTFTMSGGKISGNTASSTSSNSNLSAYGGGVYATGAFTMSGEARITADNPVCLESRSSPGVTIGGDFTGPDGPVAVIDLYSRSNTASSWSGKAVIALADGYTGGDLSVLRTRFTLGSFVSDSTTTPITGYVIGEGGHLEAAP
jgi:hypothetical protein